MVDFVNLTRWKKINGKLDKLNTDIRSLKIKTKDH